MKISLIVLSAVLTCMSAISAQDLNCQISKSCDSIMNDLNKIDSIYSGLSYNDIKRLKSRLIGDGSMTEYDALSMAHDQISGGVETYKYYLRHFKDSKIKEQFPGGKL